MPGTRHRKAQPPAAAGQSAVEFALTLPILLLLFFGLADLGRAVYMQNVLAAVARDGARAAALVPGDCGQVVQVVRARASLVDLSAPGAVQLQAPADPVIGDPITVRVRARFTPVTPVIGTLIGTGGFPLAGESTMAIQGLSVTAPMPCP